MSFAGAYVESAYTRLGFKADRVDHLLKCLSEKGQGAVENEKRKVKEELRGYDTEHSRIFKRLPSKAEKEPMRPMYQYYEELKRLLIGKNIEVGRRGSNASSVSDGEAEDRRRMTLKRRFHEIRTELVKYQGDFFRRHGRRVMYHADIAPVHKQYKEYKEIKTRIAMLDQQTGDRRGRL
eukprot:GHVO01022973.1.p1 GENE.GHVO01022973.1~~GHVO01022973.1.p1  ORF type:complete len:179 (-),score=19.58 GHVO01022973.1:202-738(-)